MSRTFSPRTSAEPPVVPESAGRVLLVDGPPETRDVLEAVFAPRGVAVERVRSDSPLPTDAVDPSVLVLHEVETATPETRVVVGRSDGGELPGRAFTQPFEFGELVREIETLLESRPGVA